MVSLISAPQPALLVLSLGGSLFLGTTAVRAAAHVSEPLALLLPRGVVPPSPARGDAFPCATPNVILTCPCAGVATAPPSPTPSLPQHQAAAAAQLRESLGAAERATAAAQEDAVKLRAQLDESQAAAKEAKARFVAAAKRK